MTESTSEVVTYLLTTVDNQYDPRTQFDEWLREDARLGYNSLGLLARITVSSDELSGPDQSLAIQLAIDEIVEYNVSGMHTKVPLSTTHVSNTEDVPT